MNEQEREYRIDFLRSHFNWEAIYAYMEEYWELSVDYDEGFDFEDLSDNLLEDISDAFGY